MDSYNKWIAHIVDLDLLYAHLYAKIQAGHYLTTRMREIQTICIFTLCIENGTNKRYQVGFQPKDQRVVPVRIENIFDDSYHIMEENCDLVLIDVPTRLGQNEVEHHRCQLTSFVNQPKTTEVQWVKFLKKKLRREQDDDLRLVIHCEQEGPINFQFLSSYLCYKGTNCPYSQVFLFGEIINTEKTWQCYQLYPVLAIFSPLTKERAESLLKDRPRMNPDISNNNDTAHN